MERIWQTIARLYSLFFTPQGCQDQGKCWPLSLAAYSWLAAHPARQHLCPFSLPLQKQTSCLSTAESILRHLGQVLPIKHCSGPSLSALFSFLLLLCPRKEHPLCLANWLGDVRCRGYDELVVQSL